MAGQVQVRLVAKDDATKVFRQFKKNAESSFENVGKSVQLNIDRANRALDKFDAKQKTVARNTKKETGLAGAALAIFGKGWLKALASVIKFGSAVAIIKSVTAAIKLGVEVFSQFEVAAQRLSTIGASSAEVDKIRQSILALSPALGNSQNLIEATFTALTRGARDADQALQITQVAAAGAIGQFGDVKEAVSLLTQITNAYKGENIDLTSAMDKLQAVAALGNAEFRDLIPSLGQALPIAKSMNISFDNAANAIAQMAKVTGSAQRATIQFRAVLNQIAQRAAQFAKEGVNVREILGERNGLVKVMRLVQQSTSGSLFELRKFFTNIRAINGASILSVENLNALEQAFSAVEGASGLTERNLQIVNNTLGNTFQNTINAVRQAFLKLAGDDSTALRSALVGIANVFITLGNNANQIRGFLSLLSPVVGGLVAIFGGLATVVLAIADGLARLGGTITAITGQITEFTGKVAGLIPGLGGVGKATEDFGRNMKEAGQEVLSTGTMMGELASVTGKATVSTLEALNTTMIDNISNMDKVGKQTALMTALNNEQISSLQNQNAEFRKQASATGEAEQGITKLNAATQELRTTAVPALNETSEATDKIKSAMEKGQQAAVGQTSAIRGLLPVTADVVRQMDALGIKFEDVQANAEKLRGEINFLNSASKAANTAFETLFGKTLEKATEEMQETVEAFKNLRNEGIVPVERLVSDIIAEIDKMSKLFGADSQIVQQLQIQLDAMATKAEQGFKRVFGSMPKELEEAAQKTMKAFRDIIDGGTFPFAELTKKIEAEIAKQEKILGPNSKVVIALKEMLKELFKEGQLGFRRVFGALPEEAEKATSKAIEELRDFVPKGRASLVKFRDAVKAEMDKAAAQFGENSPFTRELRRMLERAEAQLGEGRNKMKRILDQIGVDLQLPAEGAAEKFREAFQRIIDSGKFTQIEMHEIFINQIRPQLLRTPEGVPQVWNAKFGEAGRGARELQRNVESNMKGISTATKKEAKVSSEAMKSALEEMGVNTKLFTGTWLEQSEIRRNAIREEVNEATSLLDQFRGTMNTTMDFGQSSDSILGGAGTDLVRFENMTTQQLQQLLSNLQLSNTARQNILQILRDRAAGNAQDTASQAGQILGGGGGGATGAGGAGGGGNRISARPFAGDDSFRAANEELARQIEILKFRQREETKGIETLFQRERQLKEEIQTLDQQIASAKARGATAVEINKLLQTQSIKQTLLKRNSDEIVSIRQREFFWVQQINAAQAELQERLNQMIPAAREIAATTISVGTGGGPGSLFQEAFTEGGTFESSTGNLFDRFRPPRRPGAPTEQTTQENTQALNDNTSALQETGQQIASGGSADRERPPSFRPPATISPGTGIFSPTQEVGIFGPKLPGSDDTSATIGLGAFTRGGSRRTFAPLQGGGTAPERGLFPLERGERILSRMTSDALDRMTAGNSFGGANLLASGRGATSITRGPQTGGSLAGFNPAFNIQRLQQQALNQQIQQAASRGRLQDVLGNTTQRTLAKAIVPATRVALRRRDITKDISTNTALTQQGIATIK